MAQLSNIVKQYLDIYQDKNRCFCHLSQGIKLDDDRLKLFMENDEIPEIQFLLAYYYHNVKKIFDISYHYAIKSIKNGCGLGYNILAQITQLEMILLSIVI